MFSPIYTVTRERRPSGGVPFQGVLKRMLTGRRGPGRAFTLIELLLVMAIMILLASFVGPAASTMTKGTQLTQAGQMVSDQLGLARQTALSRGRSVEVRFYQYSDPDIPGESAGSASTGKYRAMQCFLIPETGTPVALGQVQKLPNSIIVDSSADSTNALSTLLGVSQSKAWSASDPQVSLPRASTSYNCRAFRFLRDGSTNLSKSGSWFLTLHELNKGDNLTTLTNLNFVTLQIDPYNGHIKTFRP